MKASVSKNIKQTGFGGTKKPARSLMAKVFEHLVYTRHVGALQVLLIRSCQQSSLRVDSDTILNLQMRKTRLRNTNQLPHIAYPVTAELASNSGFVTL